MKKIIKDSLKRLKKDITISILVVLLMMIFNPLRGTKTYLKETSDFYPLCIFIFCLIYATINTITFYFQNKPGKLDIKYFREHPKNYSPSIVSTILDLKLDYKKDFLADLLYLENKKIISINYNNNSIEIIKEYNDLKSHLQILCKYIEENKSLTIKELIDLFPSTPHCLIYEKKCINEVISLGYIIRNKKLLKGNHFLIYIFIILTIYFLISVLITGENFLLSLIFYFATCAEMLIFLLPASHIIERKNLKERYFTRTELGKKEVKEWLAYYDFLTDFTLMHKRDLEYNELLDYEYAYAVALGININLKKKYDIETGEIIR